MCWNNSCRYKVHESEFKYVDSYSKISGNDWWKCRLYKATITEKRGNCRKRAEVTSQK